MILDTLRNYPKIRTLPIFIFLSLSFIFCLDFYNLSNVYKGFQTISNGLQTCFSRVNQSFVSKVFSVNKNSNHLKPEFFTLSEECFGDVLKRGEPLYSQLGREMDPKINALVSEIYWIHKDFKGNVELDKLKKRFKKIESINIEAMRDFEKLDNEGSKKIEKRKIWFLLSYIGLFLTLLIEILVTSKSQIQGITQEEPFKKKTEIITSVLTYPVIPAIPKPNFINNFQNINSVVNLPGSLKTEGEEKDIPEKAYLEEVLTKIVDILSVPLFTKGIKLELEVNEDLMVYMTNEVLEQSLFSFLNFSINNFPENNLDRRISLKTRLLGETAVFEIKNNGVIFGEDFLKDANGLSLNYGLNKRILDLKIGSELICDHAGKVYFENLLGEPVIRVQLKSSKLKNQRIRTRLIRNDNLGISV
jgi:hypothetical protein